MEEAKLRRGEVPPCRGDLLEALRDTNKFHHFPLGSESC